VFTYREHVHTVNALESALLARLDELGLAVRRTRVRNHDADLCIELPTRHGPRTAFLEVKSSESPVSLTHYADQRGDRAPHVIIGQRHVPDGLGRRYRAGGVNYIDSGGNAWISAPGYLVNVEGRKPAIARSPGRERPSRALSPTGLQVVFALLVRPDLVASPLRQIAAAADVSLGATQGAVEDLKGEGFVFSTGGKRALADVPKLADQWVTRFETDLRPRLDEATLHGPEPRWWISHLSDARWDAALSGETAMAALGYPIRPETVTLYGQPPWHPVRKAARLKAGELPNVSLRERFWNTDYLGADALVPRLLVYADALASDDARQIEVAREMRQEDAELRRLFAGT
jgi:hypothetical protein